MAMRARSAPRATKLAPSGNPYEQQPQYSANPFSGESTSVLSTSELEYMTASAKEIPPATREEERKKQLSMTSKARYSNWGNTLEALREKKKRDRVIKLDEAEKKQQVIDRKEMAYQEQQRRTAIDRANKLLFQQNDKVKSLNSALKLSDAMKERSKQIIIKRQRIKQAERFDEMWHAMELETQQKMLRREEEEAFEQKQRALDLAKTQLEQLQDFRERQTQSLMADIAEGERTRAIAREAKEDARQQEIAKIRQAEENAREYVRANEEQKRIKAEYKKLDEIEDAKIEKYAAERDRLKEMRRKREAEIHAEKQARHARMMKQQYEHLSKLRNQETTRIEKEAEEMKARDEANVRAEAERVQRLQDTINKSRELQITRKAEEKTRERALEEIMVGEWARRARQTEAQEAKEEAKLKSNNKKHQSALLSQIEEKQKIGKRERRDELDRARRLREHTKRDDEVFLDYATQCINDYAAKGQSIVPMKLVLARQERAPRTVTIPY